MVTSRNAAPSIALAARRCQVTGVLRGGNEAWHADSADRGLWLHRLRGGAPGNPGDRPQPDQHRQNDLRGLGGCAGGGASAIRATCTSAPDITDHAAMRAAFAAHQPDAVMHLAAEIARGPLDRRPRTVHPDERRRHLHVARGGARVPGPRCRRRAAMHSASITSPPTRCSARWAPDDAPFTETTAYDPRSPYSASKAASDHLVRAWHHTYGLPTIVSNTANNYGPWQFPEKLIPLITLNALEGKTLPVYGDGSNRRDWIYVEDHAEALLRGDRARPARRHLRDRRPPAAQQSRRGARHLRRPSMPSCPTRPARVRG